jgi:hypothetical protein
MIREKPHCVGSEIAIEWERLATTCSPCNRPFTMTDKCRMADAENPSYLRWFGARRRAFSVRLSSF